MGGGGERNEAGSSLMYGTYVLCKSLTSGGRENRSTGWRIEGPSSTEEERTI